MKTQKLIKLLYVSTLNLLLFSCKKYYKEDAVVNFHLFNPVTNEAYSNVTVKIIEQKDVTKPFQLSNEYENEVIWEGKTDSNGKASYSFKGRKNDKYTYWSSVDQSFLNGKYIIDQPEYGPIEMLSTTTLTYKAVVDNIGVVTWLKNTDCFDANDKFRFHKKSLSDPGAWDYWTPTNNNYFEGCYELLTGISQQRQEIWDIEMEVTRNGIVSTLRDTFYITGQNGTDTIKLFY